MNKRKKILNLKSESNFQLLSPNEILQTSDLSILSSGNHLEECFFSCTQQVEICLPSKTGRHSSQVLIYLTIWSRPGKMINDVMDRETVLGINFGSETKNSFLLSVLFMTNLRNFSSSLWRFLWHLCNRMIDGWMVGQTDGWWMDGRIVGWKVGWMNVDRWTIEERILSWQNTS